jgi:hypothetical protein
MMKMFKIAADPDIRAAGQKMIQQLKDAGVDVTSKVC